MIESIQKYSGGDRLGYKLFGELLVVDFAKIIPMKSILNNALYHPDGELWILPLENYCKVGVTAFGQEFFRAIKSVEFPVVDEFYNQEDWMASIETDKVDTDLYFPISGKVVSINQKLIIQPYLINESPYEEGWILKLSEVKQQEIEGLMKADGYQKFLDTFFKK